MSEGGGSRKDRKTGSPKERVKNQEPGTKKSEVSSPMLRQAQHDKENPEIKELTTHHSPLTTKMEVHHHPEVEKKGLKEYILEGLMIFVAVTMGFFAEGIRENISDGEHVKQLTVQLVHDLKNDTAALRRIDSAESLILKQTDTLLRLLQRPIAKTDMRKVQLLIVECCSQWTFFPSLGGIAAIKNELRLKQFSNSKITSYLAGYEWRNNFLRQIEDVHGRMMTEDIDGFIKRHFSSASLAAALDRKPMPDEQMHNLAQNDLPQLATELVLIRDINKAMITYNRQLKAQAIETINYVKKQYDLEDE